MHNVDEETDERLDFLMNLMLRKDLIKNPMDTIEYYKHKLIIKDIIKEIILEEIGYKIR